MEDIFIKPGNQERGWNDPPQFSYGLQVAHTPPRNLLNKRPAPPKASGTGVPPTSIPSSNSLPPPLCGVAPPPLLQAGPPADELALPPPHRGPMGSWRTAVSSQSEPEVEAIMLVLNRALDACRKSIRDQVCNDVAKRLHLLENSWKTGKLSLPVRKRMEILTIELQSGHWDSADELHRSLMVDHVTEVSQWMVGVKRLIAETRNLSPELLGALQEPAEPVQDSAEPVQDSAEPVQDSVEPVQDSAEPVQDSAEPVQDSVEPVQDTVEPVQDTVEPVQDTVEPVQDTVEPVQDSVEPVQDPVQPVQDPVEPVQYSVEPVKDPVVPVQNAVEPVQDAGSKS